jgi:tetratricopeptide (TPR) repeat protein
MISSTARHCWIIPAAASRTDPDGKSAPEPRLDLDVSCHRRLRGPYTGGGGVLRSIVPEVLIANPELVAARAIEVIAVAPELTPLVPSPPQTLTNLAVKEERTRFYHATRALRIAHGIAELLTDWARLTHPDGAVIVLRDLDDADPTDRDFVSILLRRCDPSVLTVIVEASDGADDALGQALVAYSQRVAGLPGEQPVAPVPGADLAQLYIDSDCTRREPALLSAYAELPVPERARRHTARAEHLAALGEPTLQFGAIPYHLERGTDPAGAGAEAFVAAVNGCFAVGFYEAAKELALRGRQLIVDTDQTARYWAFTHKVSACSAYLGRGDQALRHLAELQQSSLDADTHMGVSYLLAMLYTRFLPPEDHDEDVALAWVNNAIALADNHPDLTRRPFVKAFMRNARALVELHRGNLKGALNLVDEAIRITEAELGPDEQLLHRSVLLYNQAQVHAALKDHGSSLAEYDELIRRDPDYGDYYFERAAEHRAVGRYAEALDDYAATIRLTPPFYEAHYNRADLLREIGDDDGALRDLNYALELEPGHVDSLVNRADLLLALGDPERARADVDRGLAANPGNPNLLTARGQLLDEAGDAEAAYASYTEALGQDPAFAAALANRAVLSYTAGRLTEAVGDLDYAIELTDDPALRANRAVALQDLGDHRRALEDLDLAVAGLGTDDPDLLYRRGVSRRALDDLDGALADWRAHLAAYDGSGGDSPYRDRIRLLDGDLAVSGQATEKVG